MILADLETGSTSSTEAAADSNTQIASDGHLVVVATEQQRVASGISRNRLLGCLVAYFPIATILSAFVINAFALDPRRELSGYIRTVFIVYSAASCVLNHIVRRLVHGDQMAEDIVPQTVSKALTNAAQFRFDSALNISLISIALNEVRPGRRYRWCGCIR